MIPTKEQVEAANNLEDRDASFIVSILAACDARIRAEAFEEAAGMSFYRAHFLLNEPDKEAAVEEASRLTEDFKDKANVDDEN